MLHIYIHIYIYIYIYKHIYIYIYIYIFFFFLIGVSMWLDYQLYISLNELFSIGTCVQKLCRSVSSAGLLISKSFGLILLYLIQSPTL